MRKNPHDRTLRGEPKEQHLSNLILALLPKKKKKKHFVINNITLSI